MITKKMLLYFPQCATESPIVYHLVKDYDLMINIFRARVTPDEEGFLLLDVSGSEENILKGSDYLRSLKIQINETVKGVSWDRDKCVQCGSCVPHCPTEALTMPDRTIMELKFNSNECVECLSCIKVCPFGALSSIF